MILTHLIFTVYSIYLKYFEVLVQAPALQVRRMVGYIFTCVGFIKLLFSAFSRSYEYVIC